jgi:periplasmic divalent cation tolerance protein
MNVNGFGMAVISAPSDRAEGIARTMVEKRLAACAQVTAEVSSVYWWKGAVESEKERLIFLKTERGMMKAIGDLLREIHPYEVPELLMLSVVEGNPGYLAWIAATLGK